MSEFDEAFDKILEEGNGNTVKCLRQALKGLDDLDYKMRRWFAHGDESESIERIKSIKLLVQEALSDLE